MELIVKTANAILPVFLIMGLGYFLRRVGLFTAEIISGINRVAFMVVLPVLLFQKIGSYPISDVFNGALILGTLICYGAIWIGTFAMVKIADVNPERQGVIVQGAFRPNTAVVGLAILSGAWGDAVFGPAGMLLGALVPFMNALSVLALLLPHYTKEGLKGFGGMLIAVVSNPLIIGALLGTARSVTGLHPPTAINDTLEMITEMAIPLALLGVGGSLRFDKMRIDMSASLVTSMLKLVIMPALAWAILAGVFNLDGMILAIGVIYAAAPTATSSFIMADQMKGDSDLAASILVFTGLISILTLSGWLAALFRWG